MESEVNQYGEFDVVVRILDSNEGLLRLCSSYGPINIFDIRSEALAEEPEDEEYNPAKPYNISEMLLRKKAIIK